MLQMGVVAVQVVQTGWMYFKSRDRRIFGELDEGCERKIGVKLTPG